ncbi:MAG TPA: lantibiotic dehydratase, partial [Saprospiraceae bacterium]|nr:lantibiotic dehydratase [Saprospiraceae bacterium]
MKPDIFPLILIRAAGLPSDTLRLDDERLSAAWETCGRSETERQNRHSALQHALSEVLAHLPEGPERSAVYNLRKRLHQQPHHLPAPDWMSAWQAPEAQAVREKIRDLQAAHERLRAACAAWEGEYEHTWQAGLSALRHIATDTEVVGRSLLFSSHDLLSALPPFASGPSGDGQKDRAAALSLLAYVSRAVYKTTPLSAWASIGVWRPALSADEAPPFGKNIVTPNVELLPLLYEALLQEPVFCQSLQIRLNPSYSPAQSWLHSDGRREAFYQGQRAALDAIVNWMTDSGGRMPYAALKNRLLDNIPEASDNAAHAFLKHCTELGLIEWIWPEAGLSAGWCGQLYNFLGYLPSAEMLTQAAFLLQWLRTTARTLPFQTLAEAQAAQQAAHEQTQHFFGKYLPGTPLPRPEHLFYLDAGRPPQVALPPDAVTRAAAELRACWLLQTTQQQPRPYALLTH